MSLYKSKKSPYWQYDFVIRGRRFHGSTGTADKAAARTIEARRRTQAAEGGDRARKPAITLNHAAGAYNETAARGLPSAGDVAYQLENLVRGLGKDTELAEITDAALAHYVARRRGDRARHRSALVANATVNREVELLRRVLRHAAKIGADIGDHAPDWKAHRLPEPDERARSLTTEEEARLFAELRPDLRPLVAFCLLTGMRAMNAMRLTWAQIDQDAGAIHYKVKSRKPGGVSKQLPITSAVAAILAGQRGNHPIYAFTYVCKKSRARRRQGERYPFSKNGWRKDWRAALEAAGIADFRFHDLRHTAATRTLRACGNLKVVSKMLGHADITTTARYAHVLTDDIRSAMEAASRNSPGPAATENAKLLKEKA